jgi:hypothetical protein
LDISAFDFTAGASAGELSGATSAASTMIDWAAVAPPGALLGLPKAIKANKQFAVRPIPRPGDMRPIYHNPGETHNNFPKHQYRLSYAEDMQWYVFMRIDM